MPGVRHRLPEPGATGRLQRCLACDERIERGRRVAHSLVDRSCRRCLVQLVPLAVWAGMDERERALADWHCGPCEQEIEQERVEAQRQADRDRWDDLGPTIAWAQKILAHPDAYAILDTETTGLTATSRIVEIAVTTASGKVRRRAGRAAALQRRRAVAFSGPLAAWISLPARRRPATPSARGCPWAPVNGDGPSARPASPPPPVQ